MMQHRRTPIWVWLIILALSSIEPLTHVWIANFPPAGSAPTGLHTADSAIYLSCMRMFESGFESPYATCRSPIGSHHPAFYAVPFYWLYGVVGATGRFLGINEFFMLGLANGIGGFLYLFAVYRFLRMAVPVQADLGFLLFALGGGLGGVLYAAAGALDLHSAVGFEEYFRRYALYELVEGPHFLPVLHMPRLYYTIPLALCLGALTAFIKSVHVGCWKHLAFASCLLFLGSLLNLRLGPMTWCIAVFYILDRPDYPATRRMTQGIVFAVPVALGLSAAWAVSRLSPVFLSNVDVLVGQAMWLSPFISVAFLHLWLAPGETAQRIRCFPSYMGRIGAYGAAGYLGAFTVLFCVYQVYYGNVLVARDAAVANAISDWALVGALVGCLAGLRRRSGQTHPAQGGDAWVALWFLVFLALAVSAFPGGKLLSLGPQRLMLLLGLPMSILSAAAIQRMRPQRPRFAYAMTMALLVCGVSSIGVASLCFQGPLGRQPGQGPFADWHRELMTTADAAVLGRLGEGMVVAPLVFSDVIALRPSNRVLAGVGSTDLADQPYSVLRQSVEKFFSTQTTGDERGRIIEEWCVNYVYCPDTWRVEPEVVDQLRQDTRLDETGHEQGAVLLEVETGF